MPFLFFLHRLIQFLEYKNPQICSFHSYVISFAANINWLGKNCIVIRKEKKLDHGYF
jgi:hypothetical protein